MTPRSFLQNQLRDQERAKLAALPTNDALTLLFGQKQLLDASLTTLSGKTIGARGLDLLASSTSAAAINALGGSGGQVISAMIASLDAAKLTGVIDVARLPVIPGNNSVAATTIAGLTTPQQALVSLGTMVYTADGGAWRYSGVGSKTVEASYYYTADVTPEWNAIANKPALATSAQGAKADTALQSGASTDVLNEGSKLFFTAARVRAALLDGFNALSNSAITAADSVLGALQKAQAQISSLYDTKLSSSGSKTVAGPTTFIDKLTIDASSPEFTMMGPAGEYVVQRLRNPAGWFEIALDPGGNLVFINRSSSGGLEGFPFTIKNDGNNEFNNGYFLSRPYLGAPGIGNGFITQSEAESIVGGGGSGGTFVSFNGRTAGLVVPETGDYSFDMIAGAAEALASLDSSKQDRLNILSGVELGSALSGDRNSYIDFHSYGVPSAVDYAARINREPGINGQFSFVMSGSGGFNFVGGNGMYYNGVALVTEFDTADAGAI